MGGFTASSIGLIADDLTGALDSGAQFARLGLDTRLAFDGSISGEVAVIDTDSRDQSAELAGSAAALATRQLAGRQLFKKIDSTLRGPFGAEIESILAVSQMRCALVCPAAPPQGRTVLDGSVYLHGAPLASIAGHFSQPVNLLPLTLVRGPFTDLVSAVTQTASSAPIVVADALDSADLLTLARVAIQARLLPCGAFGLAQAWAQALTGRAPAASLPHPLPPGLVLVISGSASGVTHRQLDALARTPGSLSIPVDVPITFSTQLAVSGYAQKAGSDTRAIILRPARVDIASEPHWMDFSRAVANLVPALVRQMRPVGLFVTGGETARAVCQALGVQSIRLLGEAAPGLPVAQIYGGLADGLPLVTKAGGFGEEGLLVELLGE